MNATSPLWTVSSWDERLQDWSDRLNPVVVREVRQALRNRVFITVFLLVLGGSWLASLFGILRLYRVAEFYEIGPEFYTWYLAALVASLIFAIPAGTFASMAQEFRNQAYEALAVTPLSPARIVFGKLQGAVVMMLMYGSAIIPFLCLSYLLGGLGLVSLFVSLAWVFLVSLSLCMFAVMMGSLAQKPWIEVMNLLIVIGVEAIAAGFVYGIAYDLVIHEGMDPGGFAIGLGCFLVFLTFVALISLGVAQAQLTTTYLPLDYHRFPTAGAGPRAGTARAEETPPAIGQFDLKPTGESQ